METETLESPRVVQLADRIAADIQERRLQPGDVYLTTAEAARFLRISTTSANRAMQLLVQRRVLERRQRKGTVVCTPTAAGTATPLRRVRLIVHQRYLKAEGLFTDGRIIGIQSALPGADIEFSFMPEGDEVVHVQRLIAQTLAAREPEGFVAARVSLPVQRVLAESGLPVVLAGTAFPSVRGLTWIAIIARLDGCSPSICWRKEPAGSPCSCANVSCKANTWYSMPCAIRWQNTAPAWMRWSCAACRTMLPLSAQKFSNCWRNDKSPAASCAAARRSLTW
jgi:DNA-binding transcriptional regulator YhcF (GntR family)